MGEEKILFATKMCRPFEEMAELFRIVLFLSCERCAEERLKCHHLPPAMCRPGGTARFAPRCESPIGCAKAKAALNHEGKPAFTMGQKSRRWECGDDARCPPVSRRADVFSDGALPLPDGAPARLWACLLAPLFFIPKVFGVIGVFILK